MEAGSHVLFLPAKNIETRLKGGSHYQYGGLWLNGELL